MNKPVIEVKDISKAYKIGRAQKKGSYPTLKDEFSNVISKPLEWVNLKESTSKDDFWALRNINFEVAKGEVVGLMGRNGSGKSTLFKILSRITQPTTGEAVLRGRTASLLEVGTGFHPELTGRENVFLNGSILGMKRTEIEKAFDEIVEFSEIEKFIDTPVKFYSSGMKVRLAFSVAAHLDAEILIIDEVLAVGDLRFKQKGIERMNRVAASGRTILFVSHIVKHIQRICTRGIVLQDGQMVTDTKVENAIETYLDLLNLDANQIKDAEAEDDTDLEDSDDQDYVMQLVSSNVELKSDQPSAEIVLKLKNNTEESYENLRLITRINSQLGGNLMLLVNDAINRRLDLKAGEEKQVKITIPNLYMLPDFYDVQFVLRELDPKGKKLIQKKNLLKLKVPEYDTGYVVYEDQTLNIGNGLFIPYDIEIE